MTIEEMEKELIAEGYGFNFNDMDYSAYWHSPDGGSFQVLLSDINPQSGQADLNAHKVISKSIENAYAHLLQSRRAFVVDAFLKDMADAFDNPPNSQLSMERINEMDAMNFKRFASRAKRLMVEGRE